jgi:hypothetical protein
MIQVQLINFPNMEALDFRGPNNNSQKKKGDVLGYKFLVIFFF